MHHPTHVSPRDRYLRTIRFQPTDELPVRFPYGVMPGVLDQWRREGLPHDVQTTEQLAAYFGLETYLTRLPVNLDFDPPFEQRVVSEDAHERVTIDRFGRRVRLLKSYATLPLPQEYPVHDFATWQPYKERLRFSAGRVGPEVMKTIERCRETGQVSFMGATGFFWLTRELMGDENLLAGYFEQPQLIADIAETWCKLLERVLTQLLRHAPLDEFHLGEDMAYRGGSMIGPAQFEQFMQPYYQRLARLLEAHRVPVFSFDSDGDIVELTEWLRPCGVNLVGPCEVQAGCDLPTMRQRFGRSMAFFGGVDKQAIRQGRNAIDAMLNRILPAMLPDGGWIPSLDHRVLEGTRLDDFRYYVQSILRSPE